MADITENPSGKTFSFAEIVHGRGSSVRVTDDGLLYAVDLVMVITGKDRDQAGHVIRDINDKTFSPGIFNERNTGGSGNSKTKLINFRDAIQLVMILPGKIAKETRAQFADIINRYIGGDQTLITEINANASSTSPIAQLAQASMDQDDGVCVKRRCVAQDVRWAFEYQEEVLELRHQRDLRLLEMEGNEEMIATEQEYQSLKKENDEAIEYMKTLEMEIAAMKKENDDVLLQKQELMKGIRILSGPWMCQLKI